MKTYRAMGKTKPRRNLNVRAGRKKSRNKKEWSRTELRKLKLICIQCRVVNGEANERRHPLE